ncbi:hypothetical protein MPL1032_210083 [Mesorhizobium plurifarium]|uniref:Uncharacterized protein n=1 Tax=Mesorhizobium plurifarium TaxID=69974 RepID=A0A0K2VYN4_MESPL|nr:hypothetical protein MPL1032_210083 [Mesorhizobium plurifarium]
MTEQTEAWYELKRLVQNDPAWCGAERRIAHALSLIPAQGLVQLTLLGGAVIGKTSVGEIGLAAPNATTRSFDDGSAVIVFNSGLFEFIDAVINTFMSAAQVRDGSGSEPAALPMDVVDQRLIGVYRGWPQLWKDEQIRLVRTPLGEGASAIAGRLFEAAILFLLMHEYGHAVLHAQVTEGEPRHELEADRWGLDALLRCFAHPTNRVRTALMGAVIAIRAMSALEAIGHLFPTSYPPPSERFGAIMSFFRAKCENEYTYYYLSTIAIAHDQRMEAAERVFKGLPYRPELGAERLISNVMSQLIEAYHRRTSLEDAADVFGDLLASAEAEVLAESANIAERVFSTTAPFYGNENVPAGRESTFIVKNFWKILQSLAPATKIEAPTGVNP